MEAIQSRLATWFGWRQMPSRTRTCTHINTEKRHVPTPTPVLVHLCMAASHAVSEGRLVQS